MTLLVLCTTRIICIELIHFGAILFGLFQVQGRSVEARRICDLLPSFDCRYPHSEPSVRCGAGLDANVKAAALHKAPRISP